MASLTMKQAQVLGEWFEAQGEQQCMEWFYCQGKGETSPSVAVREKGWKKIDRTAETVTIKCHTPN